MQFEINKQSGLSLLEVLIASVLLCTSLTSAMYSAAFALRSTVQADQLTMASLMASNLIEQLQLHDTGYTNNSIVLTWRRNLLHYLPRSKGTLSCQNTQCEVRVTWHAAQLKTITLPFEIAKT